MRPSESVHPLFGWALAAFVLVLAAERVLELRHSARNVRALRARGAREYGKGHFPLFVLVHVLFPMGIVGEVLVLGARPGGTWPLWLAVFAGAKALRYAAIRALGEFWSVRVWVVPGAPLVRKGPYRWLRHPNYVAVGLELLSGAMLFGAWRTALTISLLNVVALALRIRIEERALRGQTAAGVELVAPPPSVPDTRA